MSKREDYKRFIVFCLASLVVLAQAAVFAWVWYSVYRGQIDEPFWRKGNWVLIAIYGLMFALFAKLYGGLKVGYLKRIDVFYSLTLALLCTNVVEYLEITLINRWFLSVWPMIEMTGIQLVLIIIWIFGSRYIYSGLYRNHKYMCNRACDSCYGNSLDSGRQDYYSCPDPDRRCGTDFPGQYYFYKSEKENIAEEPACYPGVL